MSNRWPCNRREQVRGTVGFFLIVVLLASYGGCGTSRPESARKVLNEHFNKDVSPGYECKYAYSVPSRRFSLRYVVVAPPEVQLQDLDAELSRKTALLFYLGRVYSLPAHEEEPPVLEERLRKAIETQNCVLDFGDPVDTCKETVQAGKNSLSATKIMSRRSDGTELTRYRVSLGSGMLLVAVGPSDSFDRDALNAILASSRPSVSTSVTGWLLLGLVAIVLVAAMIGRPAARAAKCRRTTDRKP